MKTKTILASGTAVVELYLLEYTYCCSDDYKFSSGPALIMTVSVMFWSAYWEMPLWQFWINYHNPVVPRSTLLGQAAKIVNELRDYVMWQVYNKYTMWVWYKAEFPVSIYTRQLEMFQRHSLRYASKDSYGIAYDIDICTYINIPMR